MSLIERAKNICLTPKTEWPVIAAEATSAGSLVSGYVAPMAAIGAIAGFIGGSFIGTSVPFLGTYRVPVMSGLIAALFMFCMAIVGVFVLSFIINALAPKFGGEPNSGQALKVAVYSYTPAWIAGVLQIVPLLAVFGILAALYSLYLLYLGLPRLMKSAEDKAIAYTAVVVVCAIVLSVVITALGATIGGVGMIGAGALTGAATTPGSDVQFDQNSPMGRLESLGNKLEQSNRAMEEAEKRGDQKAQVAAAFEGLGAILGGGTRVEPIAIEQLKTFVPESFAGLPRTASSAEKTGMAGLMVSKAEARYEDGAGKSVTLDISDTGGVSGLMGLASWAGVEGEKEDASGSEKTQKVGGRLVHERISKTGGTNEFGIVLGDRFIVSAKGNAVGIEELKAAVAALDLARLESMKAIGVQK